MNRNLRAFLTTAAGIGGVRLVAAIAMMIAFAVTEGAGIAMLLPTLQVAGMSLTGQGTAGRYSRLIATALARVGIPDSLPVLLAIFVGLIAARSIFGRIERVAIFSVWQKLELHLRVRLYRAITNANWLFLSRIRSSDLSHALTAESVRAGFAAQTALQLASDIVLGLLYVVIAFALSPGATALVLASGALLALWLRSRTQRLTAAGKTLSTSTASLYAAAIEHLQNLKTAKAYGAERQNVEMFSELSSDVARANVSTESVHSTATARFEVGAALILGIVLYVAIELLHTSPAAILMLLLIFARITPKMMAIQDRWNNFALMIPSFGNVLGLEERCISAADETVGSSVPADSTIVLKSELRLEDVSFRYTNSQDAAIDDVSLSIPAGSIVALVGPSGAGKSTIADLAMGLLQPDSGRVLIDSVPLDAERSRRWRSHIGYASADTFLFHDSVRQNLKWAAPAATDVDIADGLRRADAEPFVARLPQGLDTIVGDRGALISQGERQRLAIARAFLRVPTLLVLDEATNSLDTASESRVLSAITDRVYGNGDARRMTVLVIAHRLATIRNADLIYVIECGRVVESGDWESLSKRAGGRFRALCDAQSLEA